MIAKEKVLIHIIANVYGVNILNIAGFSYQCAFNSLTDFLET